MAAHSEPRGVPEKHGDTDMAARTPLITRRPARAQDLFSIIDAIMGILSLITMIITLVSQIRSIAG